MSERHPYAVSDFRSGRLRVAMATETYPPEVNGVSRTIGLLAEGLRRRGNEVLLLRPRQNRRDRAVRECGFEERLLPGAAIPRYPQLRFGLPAAHTLMRIWDDWRPDVIHVATEGPLGWSAVSAAGKRGLPVISDFHTNFPAYCAHYRLGWMERLVTGYLRRFHNRCRCTLVPTRELAASLQRQGFAHLQVVGRGVDCQAFSPAFRSPALRTRWNADDTTPVALCVSRLAPEKNLAAVSEAFRAMRRVVPRARLVLVGDGPLMTSLAAAAEDGVILAGRRTGRDLAAHYASADLFLFPSVTETFGNVTLEAMASGLAIIAYRYAAAREHLEDGRSALLPEVGNTADFIAAACTLAADPEAVHRLRRAARACAERLSWERTIEAFATVLRQAAQGPLPCCGEMRHVPC